MIYRNSNNSFNVSMLTMLATVITTEIVIPGALAAVRGDHIQL